MKMLDELIATITGLLKAIAFLALVILLIPSALTIKRLDPKNSFEIPRLFHRCLLKILGIRIRTFGTPYSSAPTLFVANHVSYLDIPVLGAILPAVFVAKSEVAKWPLFGFLAKVQNTIFIERRSTRAVDQRAELQVHLAKRQGLIFFPEGTSSDGLQVLPFKSSLFGMVEEFSHDIPITIQPISLTCTELDGFPLLREERPLYGWYGDMTLPQHLWNVFKHGHFTVEVIFHPTVLISDYPNRKALAVACQSSVARGIEQSLKGRTGQSKALAQGKE
jgi:1-acyl-sn-glycerol-3-phosphate acyltransferase